MKILPLLDRCTMKILLLPLLACLVSARPQSTKIHFGTDDVQPLGLGDCDHEEGQLYWLEDGQCYDIGERGPCNFGEVLWFLKKPVCIPESEVPDTVTTDELCNSKGLVFWPDNGLCYSLLSQGPCPDGQWLQLSNQTTATATCAPQPCEDVELSVFWPELCTCIPANTTEEGGYGPEDVCGPGSELVWSPHGEGVCICKDYFYADEEGHCYEIGSVGPCSEGHIWGVENTTGTIGCIDNSNEIRLFDLIPANSPNGLPKSRTTQTQRCHVDENGKCRKTLNLRNRFGDFTTWLAGFERRSLKRCEVPVCEGDQLPWVDGKCYQLASTGPCQEGSWLVLDSVVNDVPILKCKNKRCSEGVWWPKTCSCIKESVMLKSQSLDFSNIADFVSPCGDKEELLLSPYGDGICGCKPNHVRDEKGECFEIGVQGPCQDGKVVSFENGKTSCVDPTNLVNRIFDLIPANEDPGRSGLKAKTATRKNCHVDELGKCRKTLNIRGRIDIETQDPKQQLQELISWFGTFEKHPDTCEVAKVCEGDKVLWEDGHCYSLATTGPCEEGSWLVLDSIVDGVPIIKCKKPKCVEGVWFSEFCSCFPIVGSVDDPVGPCQDNEEVLINPYGDGVCSCKDMFVRHTDGLCYQIGSEGPCAEKETFTWSGTKGVCETGDVKERLFDLIPANSPSERSSGNIGRATRQNCHVDELGKCRKTLNLRNRIDLQTLEIVDWLVQFVNNEGKCNDLETQEERKEDKCHREGKVLFEDGECYNLLERGPCFEDAKWLVMSMENGKMVPRCKHRKCLNPAGAYLASDCQCYRRKATDVCGSNEQLYDDIFGQGICGCSPGHAIWEGDDACHPVHQQGPCQEGDLFVLGQDGRTECVKSNCTNGFLEIETESEEKCFEAGDRKPCETGMEVGVHTRTLKAECLKSEDRVERVFDLIPANQNQHSNNHNTVNKETCVLDKRGRCRRKLVLRRGANKNEAQEFENWLESFIVRYDTKCNH